ncbi:cellulose biosynthesis protein BcsF [Pseudomonas alkylphenolica]|uniref:Cellulose biosynthesis protein BcsF n=1 Tax=Pseudomonas alkylphenolica TaxID=237609 RepID=A0A443ZJN6_9PSED|nr:cellulose biosynthesis protein BcsF [Pseudomonas alkylphenolica]RWU19149.1 cellulose biosynthesis protein BcsF [Pseudomonas alkylphenolica]
MTYNELIWVIGLTAVLTAPTAIVLFLMGRRLTTWLSRRLPPRHLIARGVRINHVGEKEGAHD